MTEDAVIGIDLGATTVRAGAFSASGVQIRVIQTGIKAEEGPEKGVARILQVVEDLLHSLEVDGFARNQVRGIGVGATGPTDPIKGILVNPLTMPGWINVPLTDPLESRFGVPVCLENDADAAALGEFWQGAGRTEAHQIGEKESITGNRLYAVTVGTGIGTAFICDGEVYRGADGFHPEGGHQIVDPGGPLCYCGGHGCWESMSSGTAIGKAAREAVQEFRGADCRILRLAGEDLGKIDAQVVAQAAREGDDLAKKIIDYAARAFANGIHNILMLFYPDTIVLSGGVMQSPDLFMPAINDVLREADGYVPTGGVKIVPAKLGYYAGIYGAAYAIIRKTLFSK